MDAAAKKLGMERNIGTQATAKFNKKYLYLKRNTDNPGDEFQIVHLKEGTEVQYVSVLNQDFAIEMVGEALPELSELTLTTDTKEILGMPCTKATWQMNGEEAYVYFTEAIKPYYCPFVAQEYGFALEYQLNYPYGKFVYKATDATFQKVDKRLISPPENYKKVTPKEYQAALFNRPKPSFIGKEAPNFTLTDLDGKHVELKRLRGKNVFLNFWFTSCPPCKKEIPDLNALKRLYSKKNIEFLAVTFNEEQIVRDFLVENPFDFQIFADARAVTAAYDIYTYPTSLFINQDGIVVGEHIGGSFQIKKELQTILDKHLD